MNIQNAQYIRCLDCGKNTFLPNDQLGFESTQSTSNGMEVTYKGRRYIFQEYGDFQVIEQHDGTLKLIRTGDHCSGALFGSSQVPMNLGPNFASEVKPPGGPAAPSGFDDIEEFIKRHCDEIKKGIILKEFDYTDVSESKMDRPS